MIIREMPRFELKKSLQGLSPQTTKQTYMDLKSI
jgi:hypothetical protein